MRYLAAKIQGKNKMTEKPELIADLDKIIDGNLTKFAHYINETYGLKIQTVEFEWRIESEFGDYPIIQKKVLINDNDETNNSEH